MWYIFLVIFTFLDPEKWLRLFDICMQVYLTYKVLCKLRLPNKKMPFKVVYLTYIWKSFLEGFYTKTTT